MGVEANGRNGGLSNMYTAALNHFVPVPAELMITAENSRENIKF